MVGDRVLQEKYATTRDRTPTTKTPVQNPRIEGQGAEGMEFIYREGVGGGGRSYQRSQHGSFRNKYGLDLLLHAPLLKKHHILLQVLV